MKSLSSGISKSYNSLFVLDEDSLRRIQAVLEEAIKDIDSELEPRIFFRVERRDHRFFETYDVKDVINDANVAGREICEVVACVVLKKQVVESKGIPIENAVLITFSSVSSWRSVELNIYFQDRNWALLLADKLEPQIERTFKIERVSRWMLFFVLLIPIIPFSKPLLTWAQIPSIEDSRLILPAFFIGMFLGLFFSIVIILFRFFDEPSNWYKRLMSNESVFCWGDGSYRYERAMNLRRNTFWGVIVGFIISVFSSLYLYIFLS